MNSAAGTRRASISGSPFIQSSGSATSASSQTNVQTISVSSEDPPAAQLIIAPSSSAPVDSMSRDPAATTPVSTSQPLAVTLTAVATAVQPDSNMSKDRPLASVEDARTTNLCSAYSGPMISACTPGPPISQLPDAVASTIHAGPPLSLMTGGPPFGPPTGVGAVPLLAATFSQVTASTVSGRAALHGSADSRVGCDGSNNSDERRGGGNGMAAHLLSIQSGTFALRKVCYQLV